MRMSARAGARRWKGGGNGGTGGGGGGRGEGSLPSSPFPGLSPASLRVFPRPSPAQGVRPELLSHLVDHARELPVALGLARGLGRLEQRRLRGGLQPDQL